MSVKKIWSGNTALGFIGGSLLTFGANYFGNHQQTNRLPLSQPEVEVLFTYPKTFRKIGFIEVEKRILELIQSANKSIHVQSYSFTSPNIVKALIEAHNRGVKVNLILDKENEKRSSDAVLALVKHKIPVKIRRLSGIAHSKIMIIDEKIVQTGSYNYTRNANERNDENILIIYNSPEITKKYVENWNECNKHSAEPWSESRGGKSWENTYSTPGGLIKLNHNVDSDKTQSIYPKTAVYPNIKQAIDSATKSIYMSAGGDFSDLIGHALIDAKNRGIEIKIMVNSNLSQDFRNYLLTLQSKGIVVRKQPKLNKKPSAVLIVDHTQRLIITNLNCTKSAKAYIQKITAITTTLNRFAKSWSEASTI